MAISIIEEKLDWDQEEMTNPQYQDANWEEECYHYGCKMAQQEALRRLSEIEERLYAGHPRDWHIEGFRERTMVTRFGEITVRRRLYKDGNGNHHFLLDEYLNWRSKQKATPSLTEALVDSATEVSFQKTSERLEKLTAGVLSKMTIHRLLRKVTTDAVQREKEEWKQVFHHGILPLPGKRKASLLYTEADSLWVHVQKDRRNRSSPHQETGKKRKRKWHKLRNAITYEGWERLPGKYDRFRLVHKKVYCESEGVPFWEGISLLWDREWDLSYLQRIILNGDCEDWIEEGAEQIPFCIREIDGFHLSRSCRRGWENGKVIYELIRTGKPEEARQKMDESKKRESKRAETQRQHVQKRICDGADWREKAKGVVKVPVGARGLGAMESNEDKLFADRMKKRSLSWTKSGARLMGKAIELSFNGELRRHCGRRMTDAGRDMSLSFDLFETQARYGKGVSIPAFEGPHASRPWVRVLRDLVTPDYHRLI